MSVSVSLSPEAASARTCDRVAGVGAVAVGIDHAEAEFPAQMDRVALRGEAGIHQFQAAVGEQSHLPVGGLLGLRVFVLQVYHVAPDHPQRRHPVGMPAGVHRLRQGDSQALVAVRHEVADRVAALGQLESHDAGERALLEHLLCIAARAALQLDGKPLRRRQQVDGEDLERHFERRRLFALPGRGLHLRLRHGRHVHHACRVQGILRAGHFKQQRRAQGDDDGFLAPSARRWPRRRLEAGTADAAPPPGP